MEHNHRSAPKERTICHHIRSLWRRAIVIFILKVGKKDFTHSMSFSFRPIRRYWIFIWDVVSLWIRRQTVDSMAELSRMRRVVTTVTHETIGFSTTRLYPQEELYALFCIAWWWMRYWWSWTKRAYVNNIINSTLGRSLFDLVQSKLRMMNKWYHSVGQGMNPNKTIVRPFIRNMKLRRKMIHWATYGLQ